VLLGASTREIILTMFESDRDVLPVLRATYDLMEEQRTDTLDGKEDLVPRLSEQGHEKATLYEIFRQIHNGGYADVSFAGGMTIGLVQPTEKGFQVTRGWPVPGQGDVQALLRILDARIAAPDTPEDERTRLQRLREAAGNVSQSVLTSLLSAWLSHHAPGMS
jgi:hypothetical protein